jgi:hypothetical protein
MRMEAERVLVWRSRALRRNGRVIGVLIGYTKLMIETTTNKMMIDIRIGANNKVFYSHSY